MYKHCNLAVAALLVVMILSGCASSPSEPFSPEPTADPNNARVYVYWPGQSWREKAGSALELQVDGAPLGLLRYKTYIPLELPPGNHEFRLTGEHQSPDWEADWDGDDRYFETRLRPGDVKFVRLLIKYDQSSNKWTNPGMNYVVQFLPRAANAAMLEMADLKISRN
jgi:hypothetical protein